MSAAAPVTYRYDGTMEGFFCCVFESYASHELPLAILGPGAEETSLFGVKEIVTDQERARRVEVSELPGSHRGGGGFGSTGHA